MSAPNRRPENLPSELIDRIDPVCDRFEAEWQAGRRPRLEDYLPQVAEPDRLALLRELLALDLHYRARHGDSPTADEYRRRLPGYAAPIDAAFALSLTGPDGRAELTSGGPEEPPSGDQTVTDPTPPQRAGRYTLEGEIARGGMGAVWRARDTDLGRTLAVKVLRADYRGRTELERRFREEAQITGQLQHPGIPPVHEVGTLEDGRPFFAMKLIKGRTLADLLEQRPSPADDLPRFVGIFEQVCQTLAYAHSRGVIHRDLKPANVMVGAFGEVQVMDWGLAKVLGGEQPATGIRAAETTTIATVRSGSPALSSQAGDVLGTPAYMAPEQARGEVDLLDERCDVFGLGAMLCVLLTGQPPYRSGSRGEVQARAARGDVDEALARLEASAADAELVQLARRCLAPKRDDRPRHAGEVAQALGAYLAGVQERLREAERQRAAAEARAEGERRARRLLLGLAAALLLLVVGAGSGAWVLQQHRAAALAHQRRTEQETRLILERGRGLLEAGWQANDLGQLRQAKAEADRAADVARNGAAGAAVQQEAAAFRAEAEERLARAEKDRELLVALLDVSVPRETDVYRKGDSGAMVALAGPSVDEQYAAAFRRWGLDVEATAEADVVARVRQEPEAVVQEVLAGLDGWMLEWRRQKRPEAEWRRLFRVAEGLDRRDRHRQVRALLVAEWAPDAASVAGLVGGWPSWPALWAVARGDRWRRLRELRGQADPATGPVLTVVLLAQASAAAGDAAGAEQLLRQALAARPDQVVLLEALGRVLEGQGPSRLGEAIECYRAGRALRPHLGMALGRALGRAGRAAEGEAVLRDLVRQQPDNPEMHFYLALALGEQGKLSEEVAAFRQDIALVPDHAVAHNNLGAALYKQGKLSEAVAACRQAIALQPAYAGAYSNLGLALHEQGKLSEAVAACRQAIALQPDFALAHNNLGVALRKQGKLSEAVAAWRQAIALQPDFAKAYNNLGAALDDQGKLSEAVAACRQAIALQTDFAGAHVNLGVALMQQAEFQEALAALKRGGELLPARDPFRQPLQQLVQRCQRQLALDARLPAIRQGTDKPANAAEQIEFAQLCLLKKLCSTSARFYRDAFAGEPKPAAGARLPHRYNAACAAALAGCGQGKDADQLDAPERARWRQQARDWLRDDLAWWGKALETGKVQVSAEVRWKLWELQTDADLAGVRDKEALAKLPAAERKEWQQLWADVEALRAKATPAK
jgi:serine/threonine-protein kinase